MKVERKQEKKFEPITITLETEDEAKKFWNLLNTHGSYNDWEKLNSIYNPTKTNQDK